MRSVIQFGAYYEQLKIMFWLNSEKIRLVNKNGEAMWETITNIQMEKNDNFDLKFQYGSRL